MVVIVVIAGFAVIVVAAFPVVVVVIDVFFVGGGERFTEGVAEDGGEGDAEDDEADGDGDEVSHAEAGEHHGPWFLAVEGVPGAEGGDGIDDGCSQHVGEGAGDG